MDDKIKILIVEDDVFIAESLMLTLSKLGYNVAEPCINTKDALAILAKQSFDLILLDIHFYGKDEGIELGKIISSQFKIPFIFLTAFSDEITIAKAAQANPSAYLVKPASPASLFAAIQTALHNYNNKIVAQNVHDNANNSFFVKLNQKIYKVEWEDVISIEATKNYAIIKSSNSNLPPLPIRGTLQNVLQLIPNSFLPLFIQVNRACIINKNHILSLSKTSIITQVGEFTIGETFRKSLFDKLNIVK